jgi:hypothetical protein
MDEKHNKLEEQINKPSDDIVKQLRFNELSEVTKNILSFYNTKFDALEKEMDQLENVKININDNKIQENFDNLILCCNKAIKPSELLNDPESKFCNNNNNNNINYNNILSLKGAIGDKEFVRKVVLYRKLEIKKQLVSLELELVFLNYLVIHSVNLEYMTKLNNKQVIGNMYKNVNLQKLNNDINFSIEETINYLNEILLRGGNVSSENEIEANEAFKNYEDITLCRYLSLSERAIYLLND